MTVPIEHKLVGVHDSEVQANLFRRRLRAIVEGHESMRRERLSQEQILAPDELIQFKFEALEHADDEIRDDVAILRKDLSELAKRVRRADSQRARIAIATLQRIKNGFANVEHAKGVYVNKTSTGYDVVVTYPDSMRFGEALKTFVPVEIKISRESKNTPIEFEYVPVADLPSEVKASYRVLIERKEQESSAR
jgi:hypothetical protein